MRGRKLPTSERIEPSGLDDRPHWLRRWLWVVVVAAAVFLLALWIVGDRLTGPPVGDEVLLDEPVPHGPPADATPP